MGQIPVKSLALVIGILILAGLAGYLVINRVNRPALSYSPSDIIYGEPLHVVHQVDGLPASKPEEANPGPSSEKPRLEVSQRFYDFGLVGSTQVVTQDFELANRGTAPLVITAAHTTCACTTADLSATTIPPGKVVLVTVRLDAGVHNLSGQTIRRGLILETNDPDYPNLEIWIQATIK